MLLASMIQLHFLSLDNELLANLVVSLHHQTNRVLPVVFSWLRTDPNILDNVALPIVGTFVLSVRCFVLAVITEQQFFQSLGPSPCTEF